MKLSVLDLAPVDEGVSYEEALASIGKFAQAADAGGFERIWYAEHHNAPGIASSATAVLIEHVASKTKRIRVGAGGIMLPNHSPLVIAEQFGTLAALHPGRIDLGLGRAPGTDMKTVHALRRDIQASERFPQDVKELAGFLQGHQPIPGIRAVPAAETAPPLYILGSSLFGADLAAKLGLPYAFASHFAPAALYDALNHYRENFQPSNILEAPYAIVAANVIAAETEETAEVIRAEVLRRRVRQFLLRGNAQTKDLGDVELDMILASAQGQQIVDMMRVSAVGDKTMVRQQLWAIADDTEADEIMVAFQGRNPQERLTALHMVAPAAGPDL